MTFFYFDSDLSWEAENEVINSAQRLFQDLEVNVEIKNQARVHLWYSQRFGGDYPQLQSAKDGIDRYLISATCIGLNVETGEVYAPNGLADTEQGLLRINPKNPKPDLFDQKAKKLSSSLALAQDSRTPKLNRNERSMPSETLKNRSKKIARSTSRWRRCWAK